MMLLLIFAVIFAPAFASWREDADVCRRYGYSEGWIQRLYSIRWSSCHQPGCSDGEFNCGCRNRFWKGFYSIFDDRQCIAISSVCDGTPDCSNEMDEVDCLCPDDHFQCSDCTRGVKCDDPNNVPFFDCIQRSKINDGRFDCLNSNDEPALARTCNERMYCNGWIQCPWLPAHDESNCTECPLLWPIRCDCNQMGNNTCKYDPSTWGFTCYGTSGRCDGIITCTDRSDELGCSCADDELTCDCITKRECVKQHGCIDKNKIINDGFLSCPDSIRIPFGPNGKVSILRTSNISECDVIGAPQCNESSCYTTEIISCKNNDTKNCQTSSYQTCVSNCSYHDYCQSKPAFQCEDNSFIFLDVFCDDTKDCGDGSDEILNKPGFKCNACVLPQSNLYDDMPHCKDKSDLCFTRNMLDKKCFHCFDKRLLISSKQVCDGVIDCYDMSDECLCDKPIKECAELFQSKTDTCFENSTFLNTQRSITIHIISSKSDRKALVCQSKSGPVSATPCDGRPECRDYSDECNCIEPPPFCNDSCHSYFPMGDRYCDGVEDPAWKYISDSNCSQGFDETVCPKRFSCNATSENVTRVNIDIFLKCDGKADCNDNSDENNCSVSNNDRLFSSDTEMIANLGIKIAFWLVGLVVVFANSCNILSLIRLLKKKNRIDNAAFNNVIVLNISVADLLMGAYLLTIASYGEYYSGNYGESDYEWRSSVNCSIVGSVAVISSEASCFLMVVLASFRLMTVCFPIRSLTMSLRRWWFCLAAAWLLSISIGITPMFDAMNPYFVHSVSFSSRFHENGSIGISELKRLMCKYEVVSNTTIIDYRNDLTNIEMFLTQTLPHTAPVRLFSYYAETSICMPRFYVQRGDRAWEFTLSIITLNFLCFLFIVSAYIIIIRRTRFSAANFGNNARNNHFKIMQNKIIRIIATDFCCWIPICILAYVRLFVSYSNIVYQITAVLLLPINSAFNPFLFSSLPEKLAAWLHLNRLKNILLSLLGCRTQAAEEPVELVEIQGQQVNNFPQVAVSPQVVEEQVAVSPQVDEEQGADSQQVDEEQGADSPKVDEDQMADSPQVDNSLLIDEEQETNSPHVAESQV